jgi:hypothetical protein
MKKIIYVLAILGIATTSCSPNEDIYDELDAQAGPIVGDADYTLTDEDYDNLNLNYGNFNSTEDAREMIPSLLSDIFPVWGLGSSALVSFNVYNPVSINESEIREISDAECNAITGQTYGNFSSSGHIYSFLAAEYPNPSEGDFISLRYDYYSGSVSTLTNGFAYENGAWIKFTGFTEDQYSAMGESYPNFSSHVEADYKIPIALLDVYQYTPISTNFIALCMYELYLGGGVTKSFTAAFIFDGVAFHPFKTQVDYEPELPMEIEETVQFGYDGENWIPDNTIKYDLTSADISFISNSFMTLYPGPADNVGYFGSFDRRPNSSNYWSDSMLLEAFNVLLDNMDSAAEEGQKYVLKYIVYTGATGNETMSLIKTDGMWVLF